MWRALETRKTPVAMMWRLYSSMLGTTDTIRRLTSSSKERNEVRLASFWNCSLLVLTLWYIAHSRSLGPVWRAMTRDQTYLGNTNTSMIGKLVGLLLGGVDQYSLLAYNN